MSKEDELLNYICYKAHMVCYKAHMDSLIYGAGYIRFMDGVIEHISPKQFEQDMITVVSNMMKGNTDGKE